MFHDLLISPILFVESLFSTFVLSKVTSINPVYGNSASGAILSGLSVTGIIPEIESFIGLIMILASMFILFCTQTLTEFHNSKKTISIWTNCIGLSCYGLVSGLSLSLTSGLDFVQYTASIVLSILAVSYSLGHRYIEYISNFKEKIPLLMFSLSTPIGMLLGTYVDIDSIDSDILLGISAGTFLMFGINNLISSGKNMNNVYLENQEHTHSRIFMCLSVLIGLIISGVLQSSLVHDIVIKNPDSTDLILNITDKNSTDLVLNVTESNSTNVLLNLTDTTNVTA